MSASFFKSKTLQNLQSAFAGESMANRKYLFFARKARALGNEEVAELFERTAEQETEHAFAHLELSLAHEKNLTVERLLELAEEGERYESNHMYPEFEAEAVAEGNTGAASEFKEQAAESAEHAELFARAAKRFRALQKVEGIHADRYRTAREQLQK